MRSKSVISNRVWLCAKLPEPIDLVGDQVDMYLLFTNSHDGSSSIRVAITPIRVVCQNTLTYGLKAAKRTWSIRHTSGAKERLNQATMALKMTYRFGDAMRIDAEKLVAKRATLEEYGKSTLFRTFLKRHQLKIALGTGSTILTG